jgi:DNA invertase Pin-like site-specific DNA recombinase
MKALLYSRVSTADKGQDIERQVREMREFARARDWEIGELSDVMSAAKQRPGLQELWSLCKHRRVDVVVVHEFSRFARSTKELLLALDEFNALGIQFVSLKEQIDTTTPGGKLLYTIFAAMAEFERELIRQRVKSGMALRQQQLRDNGSFIARASGERCWHLGRPRATVDEKYVAERSRKGATARELAKELNVSADTIRRVRRRIEDKRESEDEL